MTVKITRLEIENFRGIDKAKFEFDEPLTLITGENGVGKSSVADALELLFTGANKYTGEAGSGVGAQIRVAPKVKKATIKAEVQLLDETMVKVARVVTAKGTKFTMEGVQGTSTEQQELFWDKVGMSKKTLRGCLRVSEFLDRPKDRLALLLDAADVEITKELVLDLFRKGEWGESLEGVTKALEPSEINCVEDVIKVGKHCAAARREANSEVDRLGADVAYRSPPVAITPTKSGKILGPGNIDAVRGSITALEEQWESVLMRLSEGRPKDEVPDPKWAAYVQERERAQKAKEAAEREVGAIERTAKGVSAELAKIDAMRNCPTCEQKLTKAAKDALRKNSADRLRGYDEERKTVKARIAALHEIIEQKAPAPKPSKLRKPPSALTNELKEIEEKLDRGREIRDQLMREMERQEQLGEAKKALAKAEGAVVFWNNMVAWFRDGGVLGKLISDCMEQFAGIVASRMATFGYIAPVRIDEDGSLMIEIARAGCEAYDASLASSSEKLRLMGAVMEAFTALGGSKVGLLDNVEIVSSENRQAFNRFMMEGLAEFDTLIMLSSWPGKEPPTATKIPGMAKYYWTRERLTRVA